MLISIPTAENAGATEPTSIVAAKADKTSRPRFEETCRLIPRRSLGVFTLKQPPLKSRAWVLLTLTPKPSSGGRTVPVPSTWLNEPFVLLITAPTIERNGYEQVALTISPLRRSRPQRRAKECRREQSTRQHEQALPEMVPTQQVADSETERPEGQGRNCR